MLKFTSQKKLLDLLKSSNMLSSEKYEEYLNLIKTDPEALAGQLEKDPTIDPEQFTEIKSKVLKVPYLNLEEKKIDKNYIKILPQDLAENYRMLVVDKVGNEIHVGLVDPTNFKAVEAVEFLARKKNYDVKYFIISPTGFDLGFKVYESLKEEVTQALGYAEQKFSTKTPDILQPESFIDESIETAPVSKILSVIIRHAIEGGASDIHIEPQMDKSRVRYRIDGILHTSLILPVYVHAALVSRIKVLANLKIDETRLPQDGRIHENVDGRSVDFRVSIIPLVTQEKVVMRILETPENPPTFEELGFLGRQNELMTANLKKPNGMFLVTGPTGSGKSTTLFSALTMLNREGINISTLEDPVEYFIPGINQSQIKSEIGYTFATGLRSFLRQDPDIIMVGEIRDNETVELAIHSALTGHLVLSTLHTNDARNSIHRLMDMGAQPFLLSSTLNIVIAQRLVRRICENCKTKIEVPQNTLDEIKANLASMPEGGWLKDLKGQKEMSFYKGAGCSRCGNTGYKGRFSIGEIMVITAKMRDIISQGYNSKDIDEELLNQNFVSIVQDGWMKVLLGFTTVEEVYRVTKTEV